VTAEVFRSADDVQDDGELDEPVVAHGENDEDDEAGMWLAAQSTEVVAQDPVKVYLKGIGKTALLKAADEVELAKRIEAGLYASVLIDEVSGKRERDFTEGKRFSEEKRRDLAAVALDGAQAKNHLLEANLRLVVSLAKRYTGHGMPLLDLIQEGNLGLIRAVEKFDYTKGFKFSTYATWWIRQAIIRGMADQARTIRLPVHLVEVVNKMSRIERELTAKLGREPTDSELADEMSLGVGKLQEIKNHARDTISLDMPVGNDDQAPLGDFIANDEEPAAVDIAVFARLQDEIWSVLATLSDREAAVVRMRFGLDNGQPMTLEEIGKVYGLSRERVRQIERETMAKLRHPNRSKQLRDYLD